MRLETIYLKDMYNVLGQDNKNPTLMAYLTDNNQVERDRRHPAVIICLGGAYKELSDRESEVIALYFLHLGFQAFVLYYSAFPYTYLSQLLEVSAVVYVRDEAEDFSVDRDKVFACGFSANGHLAGCAGVFWKKDIIYDKLNIAYGQGKPNGIILCYPVVSGDQYCEELNSFDYLIGDKDNKNCMRNCHYKMGWMLPHLRCLYGTLQQISWFRS